MGEARGIPRLQALGTETTPAPGPGRPQIEIASIVRWMRGCTLARYLCYAEPLALTLATISWFLLIFTVLS